MTARVAALEARLENILQLAKVLNVDGAKNLIDVEVRGVELKNLPYLTWRAGRQAKTYWVPEVGEVGMLLCPAGDVGNAVFLPAMFYTESEPPETDKNVMLRIFDDDVEEKWDGNDNTHMLSIGAGTERKTEKTGKIADTTGTATLTLQQTGRATLAASPAVKIQLSATGIIITAPLVNVIGVLQVGGVPLMVP